MRVLSSILLMTSLFAAGRVGAAPVRYWVAAGDPQIAAAVERGLTRALRARGLSLQVAPDEAVPEPSLRAPLERALAAYAALRFDEAQPQLEALSATAQRLGGGDLDNAALGDLYLHLALCAQEHGQAEAAWDALAEAVRIDPARALDPARIPPRTTSAYHRAQQELQRAPTIEVELRLPPGARARIDGDEGHGSGTLPRRLLPGRHFVRVDAPGFTPFHGVVYFTTDHEVFSPTLLPRTSPALPYGQTAADLERTVEGWRLAVRGGPGDVRVEASSLVRSDDAELVSERLVDRVLGPPPSHTPVWKRWWLWTAVGVGVAAIAIGVPVGLSRQAQPAPGSAGGTLEPLR